MYMFTLLRYLETWPDILVWNRISGEEILWDCPTPKLSSSCMILLFFFFFTNSWKTFLKRKNCLKWQFNSNWFMTNALEMFIFYFYACTDIYIFFIKTFLKVGVLSYSLHCYDRFRSNLIGWIKPFSIGCLILEMILIKNKMRSCNFSLLVIFCKIYFKPIAVHWFSG